MACYFHRVCPYPQEKNQILVLLPLCLFFLVCFGVHKDFNLSKGKLCNWPKSSGWNIPQNNACLFSLFPCVPSNHLIISFIITMVQGKGWPRQQCKYSDHWTGMSPLSWIHKVDRLVVAFFLNFQWLPHCPWNKAIKNIYKLDSDPLQYHLLPKLLPFSHTQLLTFCSSNPSIHFYQETFVCGIYSCLLPTLLHLTKFHSSLKAHSRVTSFVKSPNEPRVEILILPLASTVLYTHLCSGTDSIIITCLHRSFLC